MVKLKKLLSFTLRFMMYSLLVGISYFLVIMLAGVAGSTVVFIIKSPHTWAFFSEDDIFMSLFASILIGTLTVLVTVID